MERDWKKMILDDYEKGGETKHSDETVLTKQKVSHYHLSRREDKTTETDDRAIAAEPIQGCNTSPTGRNTPGGRTRFRLARWSRLYQ